MCPSYMATREEEHSTRGRANALVKALSSDDPRQALGDERLHGILDLCLECKACQSECPLGVDMAAMKSEFLHQYQEIHGVPLRSRLFAATRTLNRFGSATAPLSNWLAAPLRGPLGLSRRRPLPRFRRDNLTLFLSSFFNAAAAAVVFLIFGGRQLMSRGATATDTGTPAPSTGAPAPSSGSAAATSVSVDAAPDPVTSGGTVTATEAPDAGAGGLRLTPHQALTLTGIVALCLAVLVFKLDVGLTAVTVAVVLSLTSPKTNKGAVEKVAWPTVLLICGVVTYVGVLQEIGTVDYVGSSVAAIGIPLLVALLICYVGGVVSAFASTVGILGALVPLAVPLLNQGTLGPIAMISALSVSSAIVDVSPFSTTGALLVANVRGMERDAFYRKLLTYGAAIVVVGPLAAWALLVAPGWLG
ncbi:SLC13 family permease [Nonomuraea sp. NPDC049784]|uniref:SLC13 family permease n=1 Tax=Nonomuraea sp. NPDC049784 TaxID=3154361 RepID=UPI0034040B5C